MRWSGSPSSARPHRRSGAWQIEQRVVIAVNRHAQALLSEVSPEQGLVENLLGNLHDVCVSSTAIREVTQEYCFSLQATQTFVQGTAPSRAAEISSSQSTQTGACAVYCC